MIFFFDNLHFALFRSEKRPAFKRSVESEAGCGMGPLQNLFLRKATSRGKEDSGFSGFRHGREQSSRIPGINRLKGNRSGCIFQAGPGIPAPGCGSPPEAKGDCLRFFFGGLLRKLRPEDIFDREFSFRYPFFRDGNNPRQEVYKR